MVFLKCLQNEEVSECRMAVLQIRVLASKKTKGLL